MLLKSLKTTALDQSQMHMQKPTPVKCPERKAKFHPDIISRELPSCQTVCINNIPPHISTHCQWLVIAQYDVIKVNVFAGSTSKQIFVFLETTVTAEVKNLEPNISSARNQFEGTADQLQADVLSADIGLPDQEIVKHNPLSKCRNNRCSSPNPPMTTSSESQKWVFPPLFKNKS